MLDAGADGDLELCWHTIKRQGNRGFLDAFQAADCLVLEIREVFPRQNVGGRAERRLHDTACYSEDNGRAGVVAEDAVRETVFECIEVDSGFFDHIAQLTCCD